MKVLLLKDVKNVGNKNDIVNVSDGYARNYLLPKGLATEAGSGKIKHIKDMKKVEKKKKENQRKTSEDLLEKLQSHTYEIKANAGENGKLFGAITSKDISKRIKEVAEIDFDKKWFNEKINIKELGRHIIRVKLPQNVKGEIKINVIPIK